MTSSAATPTGPTAPAPRRRHDPERRDRIVAACLDVIAEHGVAGTSHRKIAAAADVQLGSMTYHFDGIDEVLHAAFSRFAHTVADRFEQRMQTASTREEAELAVIAIITDDVFEGDGDRELVITQELYALAARDPRFRDLTSDWMARSRRALERHFDPTTSRLLDAVIEGLTLHAALDAEPHDSAAAVAAVARIIREAEPPGPGR